MHLPAASGGLLRSCGFFHLEGTRLAPLLLHPPVASCGFSGLLRLIALPTQFLLHIPTASCILLRLLASYCGFLHLIAASCGLLRLKNTQRAPFLWPRIAAICISMRLIPSCCGVSRLKGTRRAPFQLHPPAATCGLLRLRERRRCRISVLETQPPSIGCGTDGAHWAARP